MRMDARYTRVGDILTAPEVPKFSGGGVALCHWCQRSAYWSKGFLSLLTKDLSGAALFGKECRSAGGNATYDRKNGLWDLIILEASKGGKVSDIAAVAGCEDTTVYDVMKKCGLPTPLQIRKVSRRMKKLELFGVNRAKTIVERRKDGHSWNAIAAAMGEKREHVMAAHVNLTGVL